MPPKSDGILESSLYVSDVPRSAARWRTLHAQIKPVLWPTSTTEEVLSGVNLRDKRILVTRVSAGLGAETARSLAAHGAQVAGAAREIIISGILSNELPKLRTWVVSRSFWDCDPTACCPLCGDSTGAPGYLSALLLPRCVLRKFSPIRGLDQRADEVRIRQPYGNKGVLRRDLAF